MPENIAVTVRHAGWQSLDSVGTDPRSLCVQAACAALSGAQLAMPETVELSLVLADDAFLRDLNRRYRGIDRATNVLAFPASDSIEGISGPRLAGDVVIALETTRREAETQNKSVADHLAHLVVHGVLHLFGFDHETHAEAKRMESLETAVLADLGIEDPYIWDCPPKEPARDATKP